MDTSTVKRYRREFPVTINHVYLDHAGIAPVSLRVRAAINAFLAESTEGAAFQYPRWAHRVDKVRRFCAQLVNAGADEIAFIKSTSHGLSLVSEGLEWQRGDNVIYG